MNEAHKKLLDTKYFKNFTKKELKTLKVKTILKKIKVENTCLLDQKYRLKE